MIAIIDYGSGNVAAISNIYQRLGIDHQVTSDHSVIRNATHIILAGVGAFDVTMTLLNMTGLKELLDDLVLNRKIPLLGICVGMQVLAQSSEEGKLKGLGYIGGRVKKVKVTNINTKLKLPHMGWNSIAVEHNNQLFSGIDSDDGFYFLHSYYFDEDEYQHRAAGVTYGDEFACAVNKGNIFGVQFHPEKSHSNGIKLFENFAGLS